MAPSVSIIWRESAGEGGLIASEFDGQGGDGDPWGRSARGRRSS